MEFAGAMAVAMLADAALGWPDGMFARIGHPVTWLGRLIGVLDARWNRSKDAAWTRRAAGAATALIVIALSSGLALAVQAAMPAGWSRLLLLGILAWPFVALRSLHDHVAAFDQEFRAVMAEATASMNLSGVTAFLERWRRVAWSSGDPDGHRAMLGRAGQLLAGQHVPTTPWAETQSTLGL